MAKQEIYEAVKTYFDHKLFVPFDYLSLFIRLSY